MVDGESADRDVVIAGSNLVWWALVGFSSVDSPLRRQANWLWKYFSPSQSFESRLGKSISCQLLAFIWIIFQVLSITS